MTCSSYTAKKEDTMSILTSYNSSRWSQLKRHFGEWRRRAHSRHELMNLSDRTLRDIGVARCDVGVEGPKLFWMR
jgi:uncharacterized protein YjiS (DUF1127 family)